MAVQEKFDLVIRAQDEASAILNKINAEIGTTTASIAAMNAVFAKAAGAAAPMHNVASAFRNAGKGAQDAATGFTKADLKMVALGSNLSNLPPAISQVVGAFAFGTPIIAAATVGVGLLAQAVFDAGNKIDKTTAVIEKHNTAIQALANSNEQEAETARRLLEHRTKDLQLRLVEAQSSLALLQAEALSGIQTYLTLSSILGPILVGSTADGGQGVAALTGLIADLKNQLGLLGGQMHGPTREDMEGFIAQEKQAAKDAAMLNKALSEQSKLMQSIAPGQFRGTGADASLRGPGYFPMPDDGTARSEADAATERIFAIDRKTEDSLRAAQQNFDEFASQIHGSLSNAADQLVGIMFGVKASFADIFKGMAQDFISMFLNTILQKAALSLAGTLFSTFFPGPGAVLAAVGGPVGKMSSGLDISSSGAGRFASSGPARKANVNITIAGDVIGDQEYVNRKIIPAIEQAVAYGQSKIQVR